MKNLYKFIFLCFSFCVSFSLFASAVTYNKGGGRFGDQLLTYLHAKWISYYFDIPLIYTPIFHSSELHISDNPLLKEHFTQTVNIINYSTFDNFSPDSSILYVTTYFPESSFEQDTFPGYFEVDWKDRAFREIILPLISPKEKLKTIHPKENTISVAIHVREGGNLDTDHTRYNAPFKLPPISFYLDAIKKLIELFPAKSLYCFVFTDALNPKDIVEKIQSQFTESLITFDYRKTGNFGPNFNVLEDFFSFFEFDILIRPDSNFSIIPSLIHDFALVISPKSYSYQNNKPVIDQLTISIDQTMYQKLLQEKK